MHEEVWMEGKSVCEKPAKKSKLKEISGAAQLTTTPSLVAGSATRKLSENFKHKIFKNGAVNISDRTCFSLYTMFSFKEDKCLNMDDKKQKLNIISKAEKFSF